SEPGGGGDGGGEMPETSGRPQQQPERGYPDPANKPHELRTKARFEQQENITVRPLNEIEAYDKFGDWIDPFTGKTYDACTITAEHFDIRNAQNSINQHWKKQAVDYIILDI